ncbi:MAG TPA: NAD(P)-dependent oxidoreductase [Terriglobales bacterium]|nr:NAD(P)-dependent oxidoreductase [Terriglobales bacterium]
MSTKVLVCDSIHRDGVEAMKKAGLEVKEAYDITAEQLEKEVSQFDALVVRGRTKVTAKVLEAGTKLKAVARSGVGLDNIDLETAKKKSIRVISTPAAPTTSVAELTIGLTLAVLRKISFADRAMKSGKWAKSELMGAELRGKTVGVVGVVGRIGLEVARIALQGFGTKVIGYDVLDMTEKSKELGFRAVSDVNQVLREADIVTIHVPYLKSTHHLIDQRAMSGMKKTAIIVNPSRGDIIDGEALLLALKEGKLGGAGLDVFHKEPPVDEWEKQLVALPNVVCTSHIGAQTIECQRLESTMVAEQIIQTFKK